MHFGNSWIQGLSLRYSHLAKVWRSPPPNTDDVDKAIKNVYDAQGVINGKRLGKADESDKAKLAGAINELRSKQQTYTEVMTAWDEYKATGLKEEIKDSVQSWVTQSLITIGKQIAGLKKLQDEKKVKNPVTLPVIEKVTVSDENNPDQGDGIVLAPPGSEFANSIFGLDKDGMPIAPPTLGSSQNTEDADPWTGITFSFSATDQSKSVSDSSWGMSVGGSVGWGLWSAGGTYAHDESRSDMLADMASCDVSITFSAMLVNIERPWLYGELFNDHELEVAKDVTLSPGPAAMQQLLHDQNTQELAKYGEFPAYPTAFIVAADTVIEFKGATSHIESHFSSHSNSGGFHFGYGPWSVSSSFHEAASKSSFQMQTSADGCKLVFGAPQIIAWSSQILPALPRTDNSSPLMQGANVALPMPFRSGAPVSSSVPVKNSSQPTTNGA